VWSVKGVRQVPYRLPDLAEAIANERPIAVVEGEKDVNNLARLNVPATCNAGGAGKWPQELNDHFRGADVVLVPDNDDAGFHHINVVGAALSGAAKRIRVLVLPELPSKGDVSDWIEAGGTAQEFWALVEAAPEWVPPPAADASSPDVDAKKAEADAATQHLVDELARLNQLEYEKRRREAAREQGIRSSALDDAVGRRRAELDAERGPPPLFGHWVVEPWPESVDGDALILLLVRRIRRHVILTGDEAVTVALWILMAWAHQDAAIHSPMLPATSAEANSGKTTLLNLVGFILPRGMPCAGISEAALFRSIEMWEPTVLVDEADTILTDNEPLRAVINTGYTRGSGVPRCIGDAHTPHLFPTFCPKALGMKGRKLPDTTLSRCIIIEMRRKKATERAEHFKHIDDAELGDLRRQCLRWTIDSIAALTAAAPEMPAAFDNRLGDNWRLMLAIADRAGGEWPEKARQAAMTVAKVVDSKSVGVQLLADIKAIFEEQSTEQMSSATLAAALGDLEDRPWPDWKNGKPLTQTALARLLKPFGIGPVKREYLLTQFGDAFERYLS
jgi:putative DNA primase/helicase